MDDLLVLASELAENNNYKNDSYEERKPDGEYSVLLESISLKESETTGTEWFNIICKIVEGDYVEEKFYVNYFLTEKTVKTSLSKIMRLISACGYDIDVNMFNSKDSILEGLQSLIGNVVTLNKETGKKGFINYIFKGEADE